MFKLIIYNNRTRMIVDITESFFAQSATSRTAYTQSNWHSSIFIKNSTSYLADLNLLDTKLRDLQKFIRSGARFQKDSLSSKIINVKEHLKICQQNIKRLKNQQVDIRSDKQMAEKLKESILITMELRLLTSTFRFKDVHLTFARASTSRQSAKSDREINLSRSHFLQPNQKQLLQQQATRQFKEIEKSIHQISQMYRETMHVVRMHQLLIDNIEGYIDDTDQNVQGGRRNLSQLNSKEQKNRQFIYKVFGLLYFIVFVYLVVLS